MRAVKCKDNQISLINKFETQLYDQAEMFGVLKLIELSERDAYLANEMHQKNIFQKESFAVDIRFKNFRVTLLRHHPQCLSDRKVKAGKDVDKADDQAYQHETCL